MPKHPSQDPIGAYVYEGNAISIATGNDAYVQIAVLIERDGNPVLELLT